MWHLSRTSVLIRFICLGWPSGECSPLEKIEVPDSKDHVAFLVLTEFCNAYWDVLITCTAVTVLWHTWVDATKEPLEVSEISSDYLLKDHHWGFLALGPSVKLMAVQGPLSPVGANRDLQYWLGCPDHLLSCDIHTHTHIYICHRHKFGIRKRQCGLGVAIVTGDFSGDAGRCVDTLWDFLCACAVLFPWKK